VPLLNCPLSVGTERKQEKKKKKTSSYWLYNRRELVGTLEQSQASVLPGRQNCNVNKPEANNGGKMVENIIIVTIM
jgi:hypothetical protein